MLEGRGLSRSRGTEEVLGGVAGVASWGPEQELVGAGLPEVGVGQLDARVVVTGLLLEMLRSGQLLNSILLTFHNH